MNYIKERTLKLRNGVEQLKLYKMLSCRQVFIVKKKKKNLVTTLIMLIVYKLFMCNCVFFLSLAKLSFIAAGERHSDLDIDLDLDDSDDELLEAPSFLKDLENAM